MSAVVEVATPVPSMMPSPPTSETTLRRRSTASVPLPDRVIEWPNSTSDACSRGRRRRAGSRGSRRLVSEVRRTGILQGAAQSGNCTELGTGRAARPGGGRSLDAARGRARKQQVTIPSRFDLPPRYGRVAELRRSSRVVAKGCGSREWGCRVHAWAPVSRWQRCVAGQRGGGVPVSQGSRPWCRQGAVCSCGYVHAWHGTAQDYSEALAWYRRAAEQNDPDALRGLGVMYEEGHGVPADAAKALSCYRQAADLGDAGAQAILGHKYQFGAGVPQDPAAAIELYRKAADQGHAEAQYAMGGIYADATGVPRDYVEAAKWFRKAAEQGFAKAQFNLGLAFLHAQGVPQDLSAALYWILARLEIAATRRPRTASASCICAARGQRRTTRWPPSGSERRPIRETLVPSASSVICIFAATAFPRPSQCLRLVDAGKGRRGRIRSPRDLGSHRRSARRDCAGS